MEPDTLLVCDECIKKPFPPGGLKTLEVVGERATCPYCAKSWDIAKLAMESNGGPRL